MRAKTGPRADRWFPPLHRPSRLSVSKVGSVDSKARIWRADPATLRDVLVDPGAVEDRLQECPPLERVWILSLLGRDEQAVAAGRRLLADSRDRFRPLLVLAQAHQRQYQWHEAAQLHEEALRLDLRSGQACRSLPGGHQACTGPRRSMLNRAVDCAHCAPRQHFVPLPSGPWKMAGKPFDARQY
jgi:hypothetical protein